MNQYQEGLWFFEEGLFVIDQCRTDPSYSHVARKFISHAVEMMRDWLQCASDEDRKRMERDIQAREKYERDLNAYYKCDIDPQQLLEKVICMKNFCFQQLHVTSGHAIEEACKRNIRRCYLYMCMLESIHGLDYEEQLQFKWVKELMNECISPSPRGVREFDVFVRGKEEATYENPANRENHPAEEAGVPVSSVIQQPISNPPPVVDDLPVGNPPVQVADDLPIGNLPAPVVDDLPVDSLPPPAVNDLPVDSLPPPVVGDLPIDNLPPPVVNDLPVGNLPAPVVGDLPIDNLPPPVVNDLPVGIPPAPVMSDLPMDPLPTLDPNDTSNNTAQPDEESRQPLPADPSPTEPPSLNGSFAIPSLPTVQDIDKPHPAKSPATGSMTTNPYNPRPSQATQATQVHQISQAPLVSQVPQVPQLPQPPILSYSTPAVPVTSTPVVTVSPYCTTTVMPSVPRNTYATPSVPVLTSTHGNGKYLSPADLSTCIGIIDSMQSMLAPQNNTYTAYVNNSPLLCNQLNSLKRILESNY